MMPDFDTSGNSIQLDCSVDSGICVEVTAEDLKKKMQEYKRILFILERDKEALRLLRERLSRIADRKTIKKKKDEQFCNVCFTPIDTEDNKACIACCSCAKYVCRGGGEKCSEWIPKDGEWRCRLCNLDRDSYGKTSTWVQEQYSVKTAAPTYAYPMRARSEIYIPLCDPNDSAFLCNFESVSDVPSVSSINVDQKQQIREYIEEVLAEMLGGSLDSTTVGPLSNSERYIPAIRNEHELQGISHVRLRRLIESIIAETVHLTPFLPPDTTTTTATIPNGNQHLEGLTFNGNHCNGNAGQYFEAKKYQDLLATAVLNKIVDTHGNGRHSESTPDLTSSAFDNNHNALFPNKADESISSSSSVEPRSESSLTDPLHRINKGVDTSPIGSYKNYYADDTNENIEADNESVLSDFLASHMVPLPHISAEPASEEEEEEEGEDEDFMSVTSSGRDTTWEDNWLFKKKRSSKTASSIGMLVPAPKEDIRALIGGKPTDEISDLSEIGSDTDDSSLEMVSASLEPLNDRLVNQHLIGGKNTKVVLDELVEQSSMISTSSLPENVPPYTETKNHFVVSNDGLIDSEPSKISVSNCNTAISNEAINSNVTSAVPNNSPAKTEATSEEESIVPPPSDFTDDEKMRNLMAKFHEELNGKINSTDEISPSISPRSSVSCALSAINDRAELSAHEGITDFCVEDEESLAEETDILFGENSSSRRPSVIEILAAIALGPMLAVSTSDDCNMLTDMEISSLMELNELAMAELNKNTEERNARLGIITEESFDSGTGEEAKADTMGLVAEPDVLTSPNIVMKAIKSLDSKKTYANNEELKNENAEDKQNVDEVIEATSNNVMKESIPLSVEETILDSKVESDDDLQTEAIEINEKKLAASSKDAIMKADEFNAKMSNSGANNDLNEITNEILDNKTDGKEQEPKKLNPTADDSYLTNEELKYATQKTEDTINKEAKAKQPAELNEDSIRPIEEIEVKEPSEEISDSQPKVDEARPNKYPIQCAVHTTEVVEIEEIGSDSAITAVNEEDILSTPSLLNSEPQNDLRNSAKDIQQFAANSLNKSNPFDDAILKVKDMKTADVTEEKVATDANPTDSISSESLRTIGESSENSEDLDGNFVKNSPEAQQNSVSSCAVQSSLKEQRENNSDSSMSNIILPPPMEFSDETSVTLTDEGKRCNTEQIQEALITCRNDAPTAEVNICDATEQNAAGDINILNESIIKCNVKQNIDTHNRTIDADNSNKTKDLQLNTKNGRNEQQADIELQGEITDKKFEETSLEATEVESVKDKELHSEHCECGKTSHTKETDINEALPADQAAEELKIEDEQPNYIIEEPNVDTVSTKSVNADEMLDMSINPIEIFAIPASSTTEVAEAPNAEELYAKKPNVEEPQPEMLTEGALSEQISPVVSDSMKPVEKSIDKDPTIITKPIEEFPESMNIKEIQPKEQANGAQEESITDSPAVEVEVSTNPIHETTINAILETSVSKITPDEQVVEVIQSETLMEPSLAPAAETAKYAEKRHADTPSDTITATKEISEAPTIKDLQSEGLVEALPGKGTLTKEIVETENTEKLQQTSTLKDLAEAAAKQDTEAKTADKSADQIGDTKNLQPNENADEITTETPKEATVNTQIEDPIPKPTEQLTETIDIEKLQLTRTVETTLTDQTPFVNIAAETANTVVTEQFSIEEMQLSNPNKIPVAKAASQEPKPKKLAEAAAPELSQTESIDEPLAAKKEPLEIVIEVAMVAATETKEYKTIDDTTANSIPKSKFKSEEHPANTKAESLSEQKVEREEPQIETAEAESVKVPSLEAAPSKQISDETQAEMPVEVPSVEEGPAESIPDPLKAGSVEVASDDRSIETHKAEDQPADVKAESPVKQKVEREEPQTETAAAELVKAPSLEAASPEQLSIETQPEMPVEVSSVEEASAESIPDPLKAGSVEVASDDHSIETLKAEDPSADAKAESPAEQKVEREEPQIETAAAELAKAHSLEAVPPEQLSNETQPEMPVEVPLVEEAPVESIPHPLKAEDQPADVKAEPPTEQNIEREEPQTETAAAELVKTLSQEAAPCEQISNEAQPEITAEVPSLEEASAESIPDPLKADSVEVASGDQSIETLKAEDQPADVKAESPAEQKVEREEPQTGTAAAELVKAPSLEAVPPEQLSNESQPEMPVEVPSVKEAPAESIPDPLKAEDQPADVKAESPTEHGIEREEPQTETAAVKLVKAPSLEAVPPEELTNETQPEMPVEVPSVEEAPAESIPDPLKAGSVEVASDDHSIETLKAENQPADVKAESPAEQKVEREEPQTGTAAAELVKAPSLEAVPPEQLSNESQPEMPVEVPSVEEAPAESIPDPLKAEDQPADVKAEPPTEHGIEREEPQTETAAAELVKAPSLEAVPPEELTNETQPEMPVEVSSVEEAPAESIPDPLKAGSVEVASDDHSIETLKAENQPTDGKAESPPEQKVEREEPQIETAAAELAKAHSLEAVPPEQLSNETQPEMPVKVPSVEEAPAESIPDPFKAEDQPADVKAEPPTQTETAAAELVKAPSLEAVPPEELTNETQPEMPVKVPSVEEAPAESIPDPLKAENQPADVKAESPAEQKVEREEPQTGTAAAELVKAPSLEAVPPEQLSNESQPEMPVEVPSVEEAPAESIPDPLKAEDQPADVKAEPPTEHGIEREEPQTETAAAELVKAPSLEAVPPEELSNETQPEMPVEVPSVEEAPTESIPDPLKAGSVEVASDDHSIETLKAEIQPTDGKAESPPEQKVEREEPQIETAAAELAKAHSLEAVPPEQLSNESQPEMPVKVPSVEEAPAESIPDPLKAENQPADVKAESPAEQKVEREEPQTGTAAAELAKAPSLEAVPPEQLSNESQPEMPVQVPSVKEAPPESIPDPLKAEDQPADVKAEPPTEHGIEREEPQTETAAAELVKAPSLEAVPPEELSNETQPEMPVEVPSVEEAPTESIPDPLKADSVEVASDDQSIETLKAEDQPADVKAESPTEQKVEREEPQTETAAAELVKAHSLEAVLPEELSNETQPEMPVEVPSVEEAPAESIPDPLKTEDQPADVKAESRTEQNIEREEHQTETAAAELVKAPSLEAVPPEQLSNETQREMPVKVPSVEEAPAESIPDPFKAKDQPADVKAEPPTEHSIEREEPQTETAAAELVKATSLEAVPPEELTNETQPEMPVEVSSVEEAPAESIPDPLKAGSVEVASDDHSIETLKAEDLSADVKAESPAEQKVEREEPQTETAAAELVKTLSQEAAPCEQVSNETQPEITAEVPSVEEALAESIPDPLRADSLEVASDGHSIETHKAEDQPADVKAESPAEPKVEREETQIETAAAELAKAPSLEAVPPEQLSNETQPEMPVEVPSVEEAPAESIPDPLKAENQPADVKAESPAEQKVEREEPQTGTAAAELVKAPSLEAVPPEQLSNESQPEMPVEVPSVEEAPAESIPDPLKAEDQPADVKAEPPTEHGIEREEPQTETAAAELVKAPSLEAVPPEELSNETQPEMPVEVPSVEEAPTESIPDPLKAGSVEVASDDHSIETLKAEIQPTDGKAESPPEQKVEREEPQIETAAAELAKAHSLEAVPPEQLSNESQPEMPVKVPSVEEAPAESIPDPLKAENQPADVKAESPAEQKVEREEPQTGTAAAELAKAPSLEAVPPEQLSNESQPEMPVQVPSVKEAPPESIPDPLKAEDQPADVKAEPPTEHGIEREEPQTETAAAELAKAPSLEAVPPEELTNETQPEMPVEVPSVEEAPTESIPDPLKADSVEVASDDQSIETLKAEDQPADVKAESPTEQKVEREEPQTETAAAELVKAHSLEAVLPEELSNETQPEMPVEVPSVEEAPAESIPDPLKTEDQPADVKAESRTEQNIEREEPQTETAAAELVKAPSLEAVPPEQLSNETQREMPVKVPSVEEAPAESIPDPFKAKDQPADVKAEPPTEHSIEREEPQTETAAAELVKATSLEAVPPEELTNETQPEMPVEVSSVEEAPAESIPDPLKAGSVEVASDDHSIETLKAEDLSADVKAESPAEQKVEREEPQTETAAAELVKAPSLEAVPTEELTNETQPEMPVEVPSVEEAPAESIADPLKAGSVEVASDDHSIETLKAENQPTDAKAESPAEQKVEREEPQIETAAAELAKAHSLEAVPPEQLSNETQPEMPVEVPSVEEAPAESIPDPLKAGSVGVASDDHSNETLKAEDQSADEKAESPAEQKVEREEPQIETAAAELAKAHSLEAVPPEQLSNETQPEMPVKVPSVEEAPAESIPDPLKAKDQPADVKAEPPTEQNIEREEPQTETAAAELVKVPSLEAVPAEQLSNETQPEMPVDVPSVEEAPAESIPDPLKAGSVEVASDDHSIETLKAENQPADVKAESPAEQKVEREEPQTGTAAAELVKAPSLEAVPPEQLSNETQPEMPVDVPSVEEAPAESIPDPLKAGSVEVASDDHSIETPQAENQPTDGKAESPPEQKVEREEPQIETAAAELAKAHSLEAVPPEQLSNETQPEMPVKVSSVEEAPAESIPDPLKAEDQPADVKAESPAEQKVEREEPQIETAAAELVKVPSLEAVPPEQLSNETQPEMPVEVPSVEETPAESIPDPLKTEDQPADVKAESPTEQNIEREEPQTETAAADLVKAPSLEAVPPEQLSNETQPEMPVEVPSVEEAPAESIPDPLKAKDQPADVKAEPPTEQNIEREEPQTETAAAELVKAPSLEAVPPEQLSNETQPEMPVEVPSVEEAPAESIPDPLKAGSVEVASDGHSIETHKAEDQPADVKAESPAEPKVEREETQIETAAAELAKAHSLEAVPPEQLSNETQPEMPVKVPSVEEAPAESIPDPLKAKDQPADVKAEPPTEQNIEREEPQTETAAAELVKTLSQEAAPCEQVSNETQPEITAEVPSVKEALAESIPDPLRADSLEVASDDHSIETLKAEERLSGLKSDEMEPDMLVEAPSVEEEPAKSVSESTKSEVVEAALGDQNIETPTAEDQPADAKSEPRAKQNVKSEEPETKTIAAESIKAPSMEVSPSELISNETQPEMPVEAHSVEVASSESILEPPKANSVEEAPKNKIVETPKADEAAESITKTGAADPVEMRFPELAPFEQKKALSVDVVFAVKTASDNQTAEPPKAEEQQADTKVVQNTEGREEPQLETPLDAPLALADQSIEALKADTQVEVKNDEHIVKAVLDEQITEAPKTVELQTDIYADQQQVEMHTKQNIEATKPESKASAIEKPNSSELKSDNLNDRQLQALVEQIVEAPMPKQPSITQLNAAGEHHIDKLVKASRPGATFFDQKSNEPISEQPETGEYLDQAIHADQIADSTKVEALAKQCIDTSKIEELHFNMPIVSPTTDSTNGIQLKESTEVAPTVVPFEPSTDRSLKANETETTPTAQTEDEQQVIAPSIVATPSRIKEPPLDQISDPSNTTAIITFTTTKHKTTGVKIETINDFTSQVSEAITEITTQSQEFPLDTCEIIMHPPLQSTKSLSESAQIPAEDYDQISHPTFEVSPEKLVRCLADELKMADETEPERVIPEMVSCEGRCFTPDEQVAKPVVSDSTAINPPNAQNTPKDRISSESNHTDDSTPTVIDTFGSSKMESGSDSDSDDEFSGDESVNRDSTTDTATTTTTTTNTITTNNVTNQSHINSPPPTELRTESACSKLQVIETRTTGGNKEHVDDDPLKHLVPGSIAEREYKKWYNAVDMPNNPYSVEALKRRLSGGPERVIDLPTISPSIEENPIVLGNNENKDATDQSQERDYARYSRDYYINDAKHASGTTKKRSTTPATTPSPSSERSPAAPPPPPTLSSSSSSIELEGRSEKTVETLRMSPVKAMCHKLEKQCKTETEADIYTAIPARVVEDIPHEKFVEDIIVPLTTEAVSKLSTDTSSVRTTESLTPSEDSDTIRIYDLKKQETRIIKDNQTNVPKTPVKKARPTELEIIPTLAVSTATASSKSSTPTSFKFLQPKRKLIDPSQVLSIDLDTTPISPSATEKTVIEEEVAHSMPSVKALAQAFLLTSSACTKSDKWRKARTKSPTFLMKSTIPTAAAVADTTSQGSEDATIASDLSSLETDPPSKQDALVSDSITIEHQSNQKNPVLVRGCLKNNIAFFENLKNK